MSKRKAQYSLSENETLLFENACETMQRDHMGLCLMHVATVHGTTYNPHCVFRDSIDRGCEVFPYTQETLMKLLNIKFEPSPNNLCDSVWDAFNKLPELVGRFLEHPDSYEVLQLRSQHIQFVTSRYKQFGQYALVLDGNRQLKIVRLQPLVRKIEWLWDNGSTIHPEELEYDVCRVWQQRCRVSIPNMDARIFVKDNRTTDHAYFTIRTILECARTQENEAALQIYLQCLIDAVGPLRTIYCMMDHRCGRDEWKSYMSSCANVILLYRTLMMPTPKTDINPYHLQIFNLFLTLVCNGCKDMAKSCMKYLPNSNVSVNPKIMECPLLISIRIYE